MGKRNLILIVTLILIAGLLVYFSKVISLKDILKTQTVSEHQGHTEGIQPQTSQEQTIEEPSGVEISPERQQLIGVKTTEVSIKPLQKTIRTVGRIEYDERRLFTVNTKFEGWIERLYVDYTGRYVKKGEPLAEIYSPELYATQQEFINLLKWKNSGVRDKGQKAEETDIDKMLATDAEAIIEAAKQRLRLWDITDEQIKKIEETGKPIRTLTIYSSVNGHVIQKMALQGMRIMPGEKLFDIADLSSVWIIADIYEYELPLINTGQTAKVTLSYFPGREFSSKIDFVYPSLSDDTRTAKVRFAISNTGGQLKPQMFTNVEIKIDLGKRLAIPEDAVIDTGTRQVVYVDKGDGYFEPREVMLGLKADGLREVIMGLRPGEKVATSANFLIDSEAQLKGVKPLEGHKH
jgi:Cu(I)/Ag(I) efflux system membrane fusion protein